MTSGKGKKKMHYYATKGFYLPAPQIDNIVIKTVTDFLNSNMSALPIDISSTLKRINITEMSYAQKRTFIRCLIEKAVYSQEQLIYTITTDAQKLQLFVSDNYVNQNTQQMEYITGDNCITITEKAFLRKYVNTVYDHGKNGVLSITDNHHLIVKAFATAWRYKELYEQDGNVDETIAKLHTSPRLFYKYLALSYLSPTITNRLLSGKHQISVRELLEKASKSYDFNDQLTLFLNISRN